MSSPLPDRANLDQYKRQAKDLIANARKGESQALDFFRRHNAAALAKPSLRLADAQHALARSLEFPSWPKLRLAIQAKENEAFFQDVETGRYEAVEKWLTARPDLARASNPDGATALHLAAERGYEALAPLLLRHGADPDQKFGYSAHTPLSWAVTVGSFAFAKEMVRLGSKPDLFSAAGIGDLDLVRAFWPEGKLIPSPSATGSSRFTPQGERLPRPPETDDDQVSDALYMAARHGREEVVEWLLAHGADPNFRAYLGGTPLHWAEYSGNPKVAEILRAAGSSDELRDFTYHSTPHAFGVVTTASWGLLRQLAAHLQRDPSLANATGAYWTPLQAAANEGQLEAVKLLLHYQADPQTTDASGATALDLARSQGHHEIVDLLANLT